MTILPPLHDAGSPAGPVPGDVAEALARARDRLDGLGRDVRWFAEVGSTNDLASRLADAGVPAGTVVGADAQTQGRGRHGRAWASPPGAGLYVSVVLRPPARAVALLTLAAGVAVAEGLDAASGLGVSLKWPNDVVTDPAAAGGGRKVAGILAEANASAAGIGVVVLGVGVNVRQAALPVDVATRATSLEAELGRTIDRGLVLAECLAALAARLRALERGDDGSVLAAWRARARATLGRPVQWTDSRVTRDGVAEDVDAEGALVVRTATGYRRLSAGDVRWVR